jgi:hypothetical protein
MPVNGKRQIRHGKNAKKPFLAMLKLNFMTTAFPGHTKIDFLRTQNPDSSYAETRFLIATHN